MSAPYLMPEVCGPCGGKCCLNAPGAAFPKDFGLPRVKGRLRAALASGRWAIDWWEGDPRDDVLYSDDGYVDRGYFVRPATADRVGQLHDPSWGGRCVFLDPDGCTLEPGDRPSGCRHLEPREGGQHCDKHDHSKLDAAIAWLPYHNLLKREDDTL